MHVFITYQVHLKFYFHPLGTRVLIRKPQSEIRGVRELESAGQFEDRVRPDWHE